MADEDLIRRGDALKALDWGDIYGRNAQSAIATLPPAVLAELPEVRDLAERAAKAVLDEYRDSQGQWTFRQEHIENAIAQVFAAAIREGRG